MTPEDLKRYFYKSGDDRIYPVNLTENEYGFCTYRIDKDILFVLNVYGNGEYWDNYLTMIAKQNGCTKMRTGTFRSYKSFCRKYKAKVVGYVLEREVE